MKAYHTSFVLGAVSLATLFLNTSGVDAQQPEPVAIVVSPSATQYRVIDMSQIGLAQGLSTAATLEAVLNKLGAQGWKVITVTGSLIILRQ